MTENLASVLPARQQGLATTAQLRDAGLSRRRIRALLAKGELTRVHPRVYALEELPARARHLVSGGTPDPAYVAHVRAALLSLGSGVAASGRTAAVLWGLDLLVEPSKVEVAVGADRGRTGLAGLEVTRSRRLAVMDEEVLELEPLSLLTPCETVVRCALERPAREGVVVADSALRAGLVTVEELEKGALARRSTPGGKRLAEVVELSDARSGSVLESVFRYLMAQHGLFPTTQLTVSGRPGRIGRVDFAFERERVIVECDGRRWHDPDDARRKDRWRDNELTRAGWRVLRVTWDDVVHSPAYVVALVQDTLRLAA